MKILIDVTHPAHVHFFRYPIQEWITHGHRVIITSRDKDLTLPLLERYQLPHTSLGRARSGLLGLGWEMVERGRKLWHVVRSAQPTVLTGVGGTFIAPIGRLADIPVVLFTDTEHARAANAIAFPFADVICTPACYENQIKDKHLTYVGYQELAYLHPNRFVPDPSRLEEFGLSPGDTYIVIRLVAWASAHDVGDRGFTDLEGAVEILSGYGQVLISSERPLPPELMNHAIHAAPEYIHHLLAFATLYIGESATMASESAILGVPAILLSTSKRGYVNEQENKYRLAYSFSEQNRALAKAQGLLDKPDLCSEWQQRRMRMLDEVADVTAHVVDVVEAYA